MTARELVESERRRLRRTDVFAATGFAAAAVVLLAAAGSLLLGNARWLSLPRVTPLVVWIAAALAAGAVVRLARARWLSRGSVQGVAEAIEAEQRLRPGELRSVMEIGDENAFGRRASARLAERLPLDDRPADASLAPSMQRTAARRLTRALAAAGGAAAVLAVVVPVATDGLFAVLLPARAWDGTLLPRLEFDELPSETLRGEPLQVRVRAPGRNVVSVSTRVTGEGWRTVNVPVGADGVAALELSAVRADLTLVASDGRTMSDTASVAATHRPFVAISSVRATFPAYLGRESATMEWGGELRVPRWTRLELSGRASLALADVRLVSATDTIRLAANGHSFAGFLIPNRTATWRLEGSGRNGSIADVPPAMQIEVIADSVPRVTLLAPEADTLIAADDRIALRFLAEDDHGVASVAVRAQLQPAGKVVGSPFARPVAITPGSYVDGLAAVSLAEMRLAAGDRLTLSIVARDNSPWRQEGESRRVVLRVPTMEERRSQARDFGDSVAGEAAAVAEAQKQLARRTEEAARAQDRSAASGDSRSSGNDASSTMSHEASERAKAAARAQEELSERIEKLSEAAASLERQLQSAGVLDERLAQQLAEAQRMLREAMSPELAERLRQLQDASQRLQAPQSRQALRDVAEQQRRLREQLEKSAEMLRRASLEGAMQTLTEEARDIASRERELARAPERAAEQPRPDERGELAERTRRFEREAKDVAERLAKEKAQAGAHGAQQSRQHAERSRQQLERDPAAAAESMDNAASAMQKARESQIADWKEELTGELDRAIQEMLQLARQERDLESRARDAGTSQDRLRGEQGSVQQGVDKTAERLAEAAKSSTLLSARSQQAVREAQQKAEAATRRLADPRQRSAAAQAMSDAAEALGRAAASLARDRERANQASSASGFAEMIQQMQQMAQRQGSIASQAQGLLSLPMDQRTGEAGQGSARALARQQRSLSRQLEELGDELGGQRAAELGREARQLAELLESGRLDAETVARQQQLFRRMLDAGRSLEKEEREETDRREARTAIDGTRHDPRAGEVRGRDAQRFREPTWEELRGLSPEERRAIQEYFRRINGQQ
jgi:hypothetical protein